MDRRTVDGWLKALIALACLVIIAGGAVLATKGINDGWKEKNASMIATCRETGKDMPAFLAKCLDEGFLTRDQYDRALR